MLTSIDLKAARKAAKLTQEEAGKLIGVTRSTIGSYESGDSSPSIQGLIDLCSAYGFNICLLKTAEMDKIRQILAILWENEGKSGE